MIVFRGPSSKPFVDGSHELVSKVSSEQLEEGISSNALIRFNITKASSPYVACGIREHRCHEFPDSAYAPSGLLAAKCEAKDILSARAKVRGMIPYSDLAAKIRSIWLEAHDQRLFHLLGELSETEDAAGRGMLSVIVVHKSGDMQPGPGFFELAKQLGRDTSDIMKC